MEKFGSNPMVLISPLKQAALRLRDRMAEQIRNMVCSSLLKQNKDVAMVTASVVAVAILVLTGVSV